MSSLLNALLNKPGFAGSDYEIMLEHGLRTTVGRYCVELDQITEKHRTRRRLYWGTAIFARESNSDGAWLYTAKGLPNLLLAGELLEHVMDAKKLQDRDELAGAAFLLHGWLNVPRKPDGQPYLSAREPDSFGLRLG
jgi:uncharacterized protein (UPF0248 family)